jgi:hypothetical protein
MKINMDIVTVVTYNMQDFIKKFSVLWVTQNKKI